MPDRPAVEGTPAPGYVVGKITVDPPTVEVIGPESAVERATEAVTEPVSVAGARGRSPRCVTVGLLDPLLRLKTSAAGDRHGRSAARPARAYGASQPVHLREPRRRALAAQAVPADGRRRAARQPRRPQPR